MAEKTMQNEISVLKADFFNNQYMLPEKSSIMGPTDNWSEAGNINISEQKQTIINNPNLLKKIFKKGAQQLNLNYQQEFVVNLSSSEGEGVRRTIKDFRKLNQTLDKTCFGIYVPYIP